MQRRLAVTCFAIVCLMATADVCGGNDPRPSADAPIDVQPAPRMSRRAQRRANRRRATPPEESGPIGVTSTLASPFESMGAAAREPFVVHRDQPYGDVAPDRQRFDIYLPKGCGGGLPLVVWIHGETWRCGSKADCPVTWLTDAGYAVASVGYRLTDTAPFPAQLDDCLAAIATLERDAEMWGIDRDRIGVVGTAAGGHLAALAGLWDQPTDERPLPHIAAVCAIDAPTHLTTLGPESDRATSPASQLVGGPLPEFREAAQQASPLVHISADDPPVLVVHARRDPRVPIEQSRRFDAALRAAGVRSELITVDAAGCATLDRDSAAGRALVEFLEHTLGGGYRPGQDAAQP